MNRIAELVENQQEFLLDLLTEHKAEVDNKLQSRQRKFASRQIEKQFEINSGFKTLAGKVQTAIQAKEYKRAAATVDLLLAQLEQHEEDLVIADTSPHGWLAVAKIRATKELPKNIRKRLEQVDRELAGQKSKYGTTKKKFFGFSREGQEPIVRRPGGGVRITPEEALFQAAKQIRPGFCSHCKKNYHFYRECPSFWQKVQESREEKAKEESGN